MRFEQGTAFAIVGTIMSWFVRDRLRYDLVAMLALFATVMVGIVPAEKAFRFQRRRGWWKRRCRRPRHSSVNHRRKWRRWPRPTETRLRERFGLSLLAISGEDHSQRLSAVRFRPGDIGAARARPHGGDPVHD